MINTDLEIEVINEATKEYEKQSKNLWIVEGLGDIGVLKVREMVKSHQQFTDNAPVIIIDYLQIMTPYEKLTEKQSIDKTVMELKRISRDFKIPVIVISSLNRVNYDEPIGMTAFKESGGIEYSADVLFGLQFKDVETSDGKKNTNFNVEGAKSDDPRKIELKILKNRNGITGINIFFEYYPQFNYFEQGNQNFMDFNTAKDQKINKNNNRKHQDS